MRGVSAVRRVPGVFYFFSGARSNAAWKGLSLSARSIRISGADLFSPGSRREELNCVQTVAEAR
jgi:hypothetical protein